MSALNQNLGAQFVEGIDYNAEFGFDFKAPFSDDQFDYNLIFRATQSLRQDIEEAIVTGVNIMITLVNMVILSGVLISLSN